MKHNDDADLTTIEWLADYVRVLDDLSISAAIGAVSQLSTVSDDIVDLWMTVGQPRIDSDTEGVN